MRLHERGLKKRRHVDSDDEQREAVLREVLAELAPLRVAADPENDSRISHPLGS